VREGNRDDVVKKKEADFPNPSRKGYRKRETTATGENYPGNRGFPTVAILENINKVPQNEKNRSLWNDSLKDRAE